MKTLKEQLQNRLNTYQTIDFDSKVLFDKPKYQMPHKFSFITIEEFCELNNILEEDLTDDHITYFYEHYGESTGLPASKYDATHDHNDWIIENLQSHDCKNATNFVKNNKYVYHITHKNNINDILRKGLRPKVKKNDDEERYRYYTERLFLISESDKLKKDLQQVISDLNLWDDYTILKIDISKLNITYWWDDASKGNTVYTVESIPPKFITVINDITEL